GLRIDDLRHRFADEGIQLAHAGVEQERLLVANQELVERQPAGPDMGDVRRQAEDVGGDLVDGCEHWWLLVSGYVRPCTGLDGGTIARWRSAVVGGSPYSAPYWLRSW